MALQPIDMQAVLNQMNQVGKEQLQRGEGLVLQAELKDTDAQIKTQERNKAVQETQETNEGPEKTKDKQKGNSASDAGGGKRGKKQDGGDDEFYEDERQWRDPAVHWESYLGKHVDIEG
ncbi:MAG: hypothetical protein LBM77_13685 [Spirochaetaceae bacterium]|jgi:hypothetical protein|nr:hypothetical protein [Spirochaetaceae bacterium]